MRPSTFLFLLHVVRASTLCTNQRPIIRPDRCLPEYEFRRCWKTAQISSHHNLLPTSVSSLLRAAVESSLPMLRWVLISVHRHGLFHRRFLPVSWFILYFNNLFFGAHRTDWEMGEMRQGEKARLHIRWQVCDVQDKFDVKWWDVGIGKAKSSYHIIAFCRPYSMLLLMLLHHRKSDIETTSTCSICQIRFLVRPAAQRCVRKWLKVRIWRKMRIKCPVWCWRAFGLWGWPNAKHISQQMRDIMLWRCREREREQSGRKIKRQRIWEENETNINNKKTFRYGLMAESRGDYDLAYIARTIASLTGFVVFLRYNAIQRKANTTSTTTTTRGQDDEECWVCANAIVSVRMHTRKEIQIIPNR